MFAATVAGIYPRAEEAMNAMGQGFDMQYKPEPAYINVYEKRYQKYKELGSLTERSQKQKQLETLALN